ncbi:MAG: DUF2309 domain-containing protein [Dehalococcoidia bacterium]|nr:DUF2309 domain-containing protein [Dehalococcoidia bacterium]
MRDGPPPQLTTRGDQIREALRHTATLLPAQGPITAFVHHNPLHAFEDLPFEEAVQRAREELGYEAFLPADRYRKALADDRIRESDLEQIAQEELRENANAPVTGEICASDLLIVLLRNPIPTVGRRLVRWLMEEGDAGRKLREDLPVAARHRLLNGHKGRNAEALQVQGLWKSCRAAIGRAGVGEHGRNSLPPVRFRDLLLQNTHLDIDASVHPFLIRLSGAFLDQGLASWSMDTEDLSFREAVARVYGGKVPPIAEPWASEFRDLLVEDAAAGDDEVDSIERSLVALGVDSAEWQTFLTQTALALRGWAGMFYQIEIRPDRMPVHAPRATLAGFMAVRLLVERAVSAWVVRCTFACQEPFPILRDRLSKEWEPAGQLSRDERTWRLFQVAQLVGLGAAELDRLSAVELSTLVDFLNKYGDQEIRRLLHLAFERTFHNGVLAALASHRSEPVPIPNAQVVFCLDEREESMRRHLEEVSPEVETVGYAGFYGVAMYYKGLDDAHARPLSPVGIRPKHEVTEMPLGDVQTHVFWRRLLHQRLALSRESITGGGTTLVRGTVFTALAGSVMAIPLVFRVLFPRLTARAHRRARSLLRPHPTTELSVDRVSRRISSIGELSGFSIEEMAAIVARVLQEMGIAHRLAPLVVVLGHGSTSLNNPHESAHDCGACGGGRGGPNARAFAYMANNPGVRTLVAAAGTPIPPSTWFIGGEHNTCDDSIELFDLAVAPEWACEQLEVLKPALERARARNAHERCRHFESFPDWLSESLALAHVEGRSNDLAQPRPEYGHATNALCVIGRRTLTRGLFLDRRSFLVSYDAATDVDGSLLASVMAAAVPVVAGINLEYYFAVVDPTGYGCGTKLPHNVSGLLGVMNGHASDLRTGLPSQMTEIHEPVRLLLVVEAAPDRVAAVLDEHADLARLAQNDWIRLVACDPVVGTYFRFDAGTFHPVEPELVELEERAASRAWYAGRRGHLPIARIVTREPEPK